MTHEPCFYRTIIDSQEVFLIRKVDDFSVSAPTVELANKVLTMIDDELKKPMKYQGVLQYFNGINLRQGTYFIQIT